MINQLFQQLEDMKKYSKPDLPDKNDPPSKRSNFIVMPRTNALDNGGEMFDPLDTTNPRTYEQEKDDKFNYAKVLMKGQKQLRPLLSRSTKQKVQEDLTKKNQKRQEKEDK